MDRRRTHEGEEGYKITREPGSAWLEGLKSSQREAERY